MKIALFGLGYVGAVTGSCLADAGFDVHIIDTEPRKVSALLAGKSPIAEPGLDDLIKKGLDSGLLTASTDAVLALAHADFALVSVGTPTDKLSGAADLTAVKSVAAEVAKYLGTSDSHLAIALCSTVPPGTTEGVFRKILEASNIPDDRYSLSFIPEFLREGSAIRDFREPTRFIIGSRSTAEAQVFGQLRPDMADITHLVATEIAEMVKTVENAWHAVKITFANEIGRICDAYEVDASAVMELVVRDTRQNVSAAYMRPGFAYGGSCLPKDLRSLLHLGAARGVHAPMLGGTSTSNSEHIDSAYREIVAHGSPKVAVLGLAFKGNTDDLRESPSVDLVEKLVGAGIDVSIHDFNVNPESLIGANLQAWTRHSHLAQRLKPSLNDVIESADVLVIAQYDKRYLQVIDNHPTAAIVNLVRL